MAETPNSIVYKNVVPWRGCEKLYLDTRTADVFFVFGSSRENVVKVPAHKCILSASSPVFDAMFFGPAREIGNTITIVDASPDEFKEFLQFFYLSSVRLTVGHKPRIMNLGEKYMLNVCKKACTELSKATLTMENMCLGYELAILFNQDDLKEYCEAKISENPMEFFKSQSFLDCEPNLLRYILQLDSLKCDESVVFDGCMAWAKTACIRKGLDGNNMQNLRSELGDLFYEIRFGDMTLEMFNACVDLYEGLSRHYRNDCK
ncbi:BTB/POZ domain-containing protein 6-A-like [Contarinia nasturtii]|uniref:BTB/POZ domain-containing protein 6-A-like n=1 Tax=Contarinia nasturtii TaxID=265458 RepID=UPI0012D3A3CA|nr:BTB/POZ domain-containing protein 6-A-like [Contarinia nasturtii]